MKLPLERLSATPTHYAFEADTGWWQQQLQPHWGLPTALDEPLVVALDAHVMGEDLFLSGSLTGGLPLECSRCLSRYRHALGESITLVLEPAGDRAPADPEGAASLTRDGVCFEDELESGWYRGDEIELAGYFLELIVLALPVKPLCGEGCLGLCPSCGVDRNVEACDCAGPVSISPFSVLADLRKDSK